MSIVPNAGALPAIAGSVSIGTITGDTLYTAPYEANDGAPVAQAQLKAFELVWQALPEVLSSTGTGRFDLIVTQASEGNVPVPTLWDSGLSPGGLCGAVARKLLKLRMERHRVQRQRKPLAAVEVTELPLDAAIEWATPESVDHRQRVLDSLAVQVNAWDSVRARA